MKLGFWEILVILVVALLVIGPDKLPYYTKKLGVALKEFRKVSEDVTKEVRESVIDPLEEASKPLREAVEPLTDLKKDIEGNLKSVERDFNNIGKTKKEPASKKADEKPAQNEETVEPIVEQPLEEPLEEPLTEPVEEQEAPAENVPEAEEANSAAEDNPMESTTAVKEEIEQ